MVAKFDISSFIIHHYRNGLYSVIVVKFKFLYGLVLLKSEAILNKNGDSYISWTESRTRIDRNFFNFFFFLVTLIERFKGCDGSCIQSPTD